MERLDYLRKKIQEDQILSEEKIDLLIEFERLWFRSNPFGRS